jgi:hypothetical protein
MHDALDGVRMKVLFETFLSHHGWKGVSRKAFVEACKITILPASDLRILENKFAVETAENTTHVVTAHRAYNTITHQFITDRISSEEYCSFLTMLLVLHGENEGDIRMMLRSKDGFDSFDSILKNSKMEPRPARPGSSNAKKRSRSWSKEDQSWVETFLGGEGNIKFKEALRKIGHLQVIKGFQFY